MPRAAMKSPRPFALRRVKFGDIAINVNDRVDNPSEAGVERYVGLEHLDPESLKIRRWGSPSDVEATKLLFRKGDIIFGRRRAYQRKLAVANFDGICSAHAMVLRARPDFALPEFLPFFMQSDAFMERALAISVGSLSPTINWKTLAQEEFALPPVDEQRNLMKVLLAIEDVMNTVADAIFGAAQTRLAAIESFLSNQNGSRPLGDLLLETAYGSSTRASAERGEAIPILRIPNVLRGKIDLNDLKFVDLSPNEIERYRVHDGDVLLVRTNGNPNYVGRCVVVRNLPETCVYASYLIRLRIDREQAEPDYVAALLNTPSIMRRLRGSVRSSAGNYNINTEGICRQMLPFPDLKSQRTLVAQLEKLSRMESALQERATQHVLLKRSFFGRALS